MSSSTMACCSAPQPAPLDASVRGIEVAFKADAYDPDGRAGWSVLLVGRPSEVFDPITLKRVKP